MVSFTGGKREDAPVVRHGAAVTTGAWRQSALTVHQGWPPVNGGGAQAGAVDDVEAIEQH